MVETLIAAAEQVEFGVASTISLSSPSNSKLSPPRARRTPRRGRRGARHAYGRARRFRPRRTPAPAGPAGGGRAVRPLAQHPSGQVAASARSSDVTPFRELPHDLIDELTQSIPKMCAKNGSNRFATTRANRAACSLDKMARHELPEAGQGGDRSPPAADSGLRRRHRAYIVDTPDPLGELAVEPPPRL